MTSENDDTVRTAPTPQSIAIVAVATLGCLAVAYMLWAFPIVSLLGGGLLVFAGKHSLPNLLVYVAALMFAALTVIVFTFVSLALPWMRVIVENVGQYPQSTIFLLTEGAIVRVRYTDTEHYAVTREFLNKHETMLKDLLSE